MSSQTPVTSKFDFKRWGLRQRCSRRETRQGVGRTRMHADSDHRGCITLTQ